MPVTSFADFQIGKVRRGCLYTVVEFFFKKISIEVIDDPADIKFPVKLVYLGNFPDQLVLVPGRQTPHDQQFVQLARFAGLCKIQDGIDRFFLGVGDKSAGIQDDDVGIILFTFMYDLKPVQVELIK